MSNTIIISLVLIALILFILSGLNIFNLSKFNNEQIKQPEPEPEPQQISLSESKYKIVAEINLNPKNGYITEINIHWNKRKSVNNYKDVSMVSFMLEEVLKEHNMNEVLKEAKNILKK